MCIELMLVPYTYKIITPNETMVPNGAIVLTVLKNNMHETSSHANRL
jgi:hypothetical protein